MKTSQKFFFSFLIALILMAFAATAVLAQEDTLNLTTKLITVGSKAGFDAGEDATSLPILIGRVIQIFLSILGIIFMGYIVYAGSLWITARGEEEKIVKAKAIIRGSIIGLIIVLGAYAITGFILDRILTAVNFQLL